MSLNDPLANVLSHILNCERKGKSVCDVGPISKVISRVLELLNTHYFLGSIETLSPDRGGLYRISLLGHINVCGVIKPRFNVTHDEYEKFEKRYLPAHDFGVLIVSTSRGLMTHKEAKEQGLGGRLIACCY